MARPYTSDVKDTFSIQGTKRLRSKILSFWRARGRNDVEVNIREITDLSRNEPQSRYELSSNIVSLGLLGGSPRNASNDAILNNGRT